MSSDLSLILAALLLGFVVLYFLLRKQLEALKPKEDNSLLEWIKATQGDIGKLKHSLTNTLNSSNQNVTDTLQKNYQQLHERLDSATKVIGELKNETGKFSEIGRSMKDLQDFLNSPKLRGNLGEQVLKDLIGQMFPKHSFL